MLETDAPPVEIFWLRGTPLHTHASLEYYLTRINEYKWLSHGEALIRVDHGNSRNRIGKFGMIKWDPYWPNEMVDSHIHCC